ncbi:hypothetical protein [Nonomuraea zeae]|uniref:Uncharacterized protein n=1 Tax=Nonomuraea zeae TaxID=1642303 RepID=A0A5S4GT56_9ACTN|nr:hypothetical protein [Nonomuraea zeae]TMR36103.1 hypothetical protein ETD85_11955 [Nonomuraea zeae]
MNVRNDPEGFAERFDEFADAPPPRPVPADKHDNDDHGDNGDQPTTPSDQVVFDQTDQADQTDQMDQADLPSSAPAPVAPTVSLLGSDPADVRDRWRDLQACFVDDPRDAVQLADSLLGEVTASVHQALQSRISELQDLWKNAEHHDTEQLRLALRSYRDVMHRLLPLADEQATR